MGPLCNVSPTLRRLHTSLKANQQLPSEKQVRYQLGEKWQWKKYNQGGVKPLRKPRPQNNVKDTQKDEIIVASNELEAPSLDMASIRTSLCQLFTTRTVDEKSLAVLNMCNHRDMAHCLRRCYDWCKKQLQLDDAQFPAPYGRGTDTDPDIPGDDYNYGSDVRIFIYLLHRYIGSLALPERDNWDALAKEAIGFSPIKMLYTMSTLIVVVAGNVLSQEANLFAPPAALTDRFPDLLAVARVGVAEMDQQIWDDEKLIAQFRYEYMTILEDYVTYGKAINFAVGKYIPLNCPAPAVHEELRFQDDGGHHDNPWSPAPMYDQDDEVMWPVDDIMRG
ncbi:hypothetical protein F4859DRAFT_47651 [Xylaria cf. heliscus]|nr:hypothetical protein F4859DRAFT_47651 [Xylaria cf. heliscus]